MSTVIRPTELIINGDYAARAARAINDAKTDICICAYDWRWYGHEPESEVQKFNIAIVRAIGRGVRVRAIVNGETNYRILKALGVNVKYVGNDKIMHIKAIAIQDSVLMLGLHNLTKRANTQNYEISAFIYDTEPILQFKTYFDTLWLHARGGA